jgi:hypothetical protein
MTEADTLALVVDAERRLWTPEGADALASLHGRGLDDTTIRAARLGVTLPLALPGRPRGIIIPWFDGDCLTLVKLRQPEGREPKYYEAFRNRDRPPGLYLGRHVIRPGRPLVIVEGEFDCLLVGQELADLAAVVTLGSASARPGPGLLGPMLAAAPWYIATDNDPAGDKAADGWPPVARRVAPPARTRIGPRPDKAGQPTPLVVGTPRGDRGPAAVHLGEPGRLAMGTGRRRSDARHHPRPARPRPDAGRPAGRRR